MSARDQILSAIRGSLKRGPLAGPERAAAEQRLKAPHRNLIPKRAQLPHAERVALFCRLAEALAATVDRVGADEVPAAVADYLAGHNLPLAIRLAPDPWLKSLPWANRPLLSLAEGRAEPADLVSVTPALAGIAETGTLMLASGPESPTTLNFLPDVHIAVLRTSQIVGPFEDAWARLRARGHMPRAVNLISGPSRTADIAQELIMGAHGPRRLHIVVVDDGEG
jgi:L-lactate dehydrogenase complex protein LldG